MFTGKATYPRIMKVYKSNRKPILVDGRPVIKLNSSGDPDYIAPEYRPDLCNNPQRVTPQTSTTSSSTSTTTQAPVNNCDNLYTSGSIDCSNSLYNKITINFRLPINKVNLELHKDNNIVLVLENLDVIGNQVTFNAPKSVIGNITFVALTPNCPKFEFNDNFDCPTTTSSTTTSSTTTSTTSTSTTTETTTTETTTTSTTTDTTSSTTQTTLPGQTTTTTTSTSSSTTTKYCGGLTINNLIIQDVRNIYADLTITGWTQFIWTVRYGGTLVAQGTKTVTANPYNFYSYDTDFVIGRTYEVEIHPIDCPAGTYTSVTYTSSPVISSSAILVNKLGNGTVYSYEPSTNTLKQLFIGEVASDIAHTESRLFLLAYDQSIKVYKITLNPFTYTKLSDFSTVGHEGAGLALANSDVLYIGTSSGRIDQLLNGNTFSTLFNLPSGYSCTGDLIYDTTNERFLISYNNNSGDYRVGIFTKTGTIIRSVAAPTQSIYGIYQYSGVTYLISQGGGQYTINLTTMSIVAAGDVGTTIAGASQLPQGVNIPG